MNDFIDLKKGTNNILYIPSSGGGGGGGSWDLSILRSAALASPEACFDFFPMFVCTKLKRRKQNTNNNNNYIIAKSQAPQVWLRVVDRNVLYIYITLPLSRWWWGLDQSKEIDRVSPCVSLLTEKNCKNKTYTRPLSLSL